MLLEKTRIYFSFYLSVRLPVCQDMCVYISIGLTLSVWTCAQMFLSVCLSVKAHVCRFNQSVPIFKLLFLSVLLPLCSCAHPEGLIGGMDPTPGKSQVIWGSIGISIWAYTHAHKHTHTHTLKEAWRPPPPPPPCLQGFMKIQFETMSTL